MKRNIPETYSLIIIIILILGVASLVIPSGLYERVYDEKTEMTSILPNSYRQIEKEYLNPFDIAMSIPKGLLQASDIIIFVLVTGGTFGVVNATGLIEKVSKKSISRYYNKPYLLIALVMIFFSFAGATLGTAEEALPLFPLIISLFVSLGFNSLVGTGVILLGAGAGFVAGVFNPFTVGIAHLISELPLFSGLTWRLVAYILFTTTAIVYMIYYAKKHRTISPERMSIQSESFKTREWLLLMTILLFYVLLVLGVTMWGFSLPEMITCFGLLAVVTGFLQGFSASKIVQHFITGASSVLYGALIIGLARGIYALLESAMIIDTMIYSLTNVLAQLTPKLNALGMFISHSIINLFVTSGSGQAALTMPIMSHVADLTDVPRQTAVLAYQFGDGFSNIISPTSGYFMAALAIGRVSYKKWLKWMLPLFIIWCIEGCIILILSMSL